MFRFITKTMCITLVAVLFSWSANAQELVAKKGSKATNQMYFSSFERSVAANCNPVKNLTYVKDGKSVTLNWEAPDPPQGAGWLTYSGENDDAIGSREGAFNVYIAARWTAGDLTDLNGFKLTKIKYYVYETLSNAPQTLMVWTGGTASSPGTKVWEHALTDADIPGIGQWIEIEITPEITIDATKGLWIGAHIEAPVGVFAAPIDAGPAKQTFGDLYSSSGTSFSSLAQATAGEIDGNWNLGIYATDSKGNAVYLNRADVAGYKISRNNEEVSTVTDLTVTDTDLEVGVYNYSVTAIYDDGCNSDALKVRVEITDCNPVQNLTGEQADVNAKKVNLRWEEPILPKENWLSYAGNAVGNGSIGGPATIELAARWSPEDLAALEIADGATLSTVRFAAGREEATYTIYVWQGGTETTPGTLVYTSETMQGSGLNIVSDWNFVDFDPIPIDITQELWIGMKTVASEQGTEPYAAVYDANTPAPGKGNLIKSGANWVQLQTLVGTATGNWSIAAYVSSVEKQIELGTRAVVKNYYIYRDETLVKTNSGSVRSWVDQNVELGETYNYCIEAALDNGCISEQECVTVEMDNVGINELASHVSIYPNPASSTVTIGGADITKVEVYNTVGQKIEMKQGDIKIIDVSSYNTGIYFFKVYDANNNTVTKRIMVTR